MIIKASVNVTVTLSPTFSPSMFFLSSTFADMECPSAVFTVIDGIAASIFSTVTVAVRCCVTAPLG